MPRLKIPSVESIVLVLLVVIMTVTAAFAVYLLANKTDRVVEVNSVEAQVAGCAEAYTTTFAHRIGEMTVVTKSVNGEGVIACLRERGITLRRNE